jgi:MFS family permease
MYLVIPFAGGRGGAYLFVVATCVIISMYGGGFATLPAYLSDVFGTHNVGAIHGRVLTAWSLAGVLGPLLVNGIREQLMASGVAAADAYTPTMYLMAGLLVAGLVADLLMRQVAARHYLPESEDDAVAAPPHDAAARPGVGARRAAPQPAGADVLAAAEPALGDAEA